MRKMHSISILVAAVLILGPGYSLGVDQWPDTGATNCYDNLGNSLSACDGSEGFPGQDSHYVGPVRSYTDNGDGTVTDHVTGFMWQQDGLAGGTTNTHADALAYVSSLATGGHNDWRLPTVQELATLVDSGAYLPAITMSGTNFTTNRNPVNPTGYWTDTTRTYFPDDAWVINFVNGNVGMPNDIGVAKTESANLYVRAVRDLNPVSVSNVLHEQNDGTVWDSVTGLMWQQDSGPSGVLSWGRVTSQECVGIAGTEEDALCYCDSLSLGTGPYTDWRLPDRNELLSIVDFAQALPAHAPIFTNTASFYWTSTSDVHDPSSAWMVNFDHGGVFSDNKTGSTHSVRCVRGRFFQVDVINSDPNITVSDAAVGINWVAYNTSQDVTLTASTGSSITDVVIDGASLGPQPSPYTRTFANVSTNHTISATTSTSTFNINVSVGNGGTVIDVDNAVVISSPGGVVTVNRGSTQTFEVTPGADSKIGPVQYDGAAVTLDSKNQFTTPAITEAGHIFTATFIGDGTFPLVVNLTGSGSGKVTSSPAGIDCPGDCNENFADGTVVTLTATPDAEMNFNGWSGDCNGTGDCTETMDRARTFSAHFSALRKKSSMLLFQSVINNGAVIREMSRNNRR